MDEKKYIINCPALMLEWDWNKNNEYNLFPENISIGSSKKVFWICNKGHQRQASVQSRKMGIQGCPFCSNHRVWAGDNDLASKTYNYCSKSNELPNGFLFSSVTLCL